MKTRLQTNPQVLLISDLLNREPSKQELQRQMERTRESLAETVGEIKETLSQEVSAVTKSVSGMLDYERRSWAFVVL
jgi:HD superfamily phosphodiesterase